MRGLIISLLILLSILSSYSQVTFEKVIDSTGSYIEYNNFIYQDPDSNYVLLTSKIYNSTPGIGITSIDRLSNVKWTKFLDCQEFNYLPKLKSVKQTADGGLIISGFVNSDVIGSNHFLIRTDKNFNPLWSKYLEGEEVYGTEYSDIIETSTGDFLMVTNNITGIVGNSRCDYHLIKFSSNGEITWVKEYFLEDYIPVTGHQTKIIEVSPNRYCLIGRSTDQYVWEYDTHVLIIDSDGNTLNSIHYNGTDSATPVDALINDENDIIITGYTKRYGTGRNEIFLMSINSLGNQNWLYTYGSYYDLIPYNLIINNHQNIVISGSYSYTNSDDEFAILLEVNNEGDIVWSRKETQTRSKFSCINNCFDNGYIISGFNETNSYLRNILIKTNSTGSVRCNDDHFSIYQSNHESNIRYSQPTIIEETQFSGDLNFTTHLTSLTLIETCFENCQVIASFNNDINRICLGNEITFSNSSKNATNYEWYVNNSLISTDEDFIFSPSTSGNYNIKLVASDSICVDNSMQTIVVDSDPDAEFSYKQELFLVHFTPNDTLEKGYFWDFGDGNFTTKKKPTHIYADLGSYVVTLSTYNSCDSTYVEKTIVIEDTVNARFQKTYDSNVGPSLTCVAQCRDGSYIMAGNSDFYDDWLYVLKTNISGEVLWSYQKYFNFEKIKGDEIIECQDLGYLILDNYETNQILKMNRSGNVQWVRSLPGTAKRVLQLNNQDFLVTGIITNQIYVARFSPFGYLKWINKYSAGLTGDDLVEFSQDEIFILGRSKEDYDFMYLLKINGNGDILWSKNYSNDSGELRVNSIIKTQNNKLLVTGGFIGTGTYPNKTFVMKLNSNGDIIWVNNYDVNPPYWHHCKPSIHEHGSGYLSLISEEYEEVVVTRLDPQGNPIHGIKYPIETNGSIAYHGKGEITADNGLIITHLNYTGEYLAWNTTLMKTDSLGYSGCLEEEISVNLIDLSILSEPPASDEVIDFNFSSEWSAAYSGDPNTLETIHCYFDDTTTTSSNFTYTDSLLFVNFTDMSTSANHWHWDFGDGVTSNIQNPTHEYSMYSTYDVSLISGNFFDSDTINYSITLGCDSLPNAGFQYSDSLLWVNFTDQSENTENWHWNFGDNNVSNLQNPIHKYENPGEYIVSLYTYNACGADSISDTINIICPSPIGGFIYNLDDLTINFYNQSLNADNFYWEFGDGEYSTVQNPIHTYENYGNYVVSFEPSNICGASQIVDTIKIVEASIYQPNESINLLIFPNPFDEYTFITFDNPGSMEYRITLYNQQGSVVLDEFYITPKIRIDKGNLNPGLYLIRLQDEKGKKYFSKIILQ